MSYRQLDVRGKPIPRSGKAKREKAARAERGVLLYHYAIAVAIKQPDGKYKHILRHKWLKDDIAAEEYERELRHEEPVKALTWVRAHGMWLEANVGRFSEGHIFNSRTTLRQWVEAFGANLTIEGTSLSAFSRWIEERAREGSGRGAQIKRGHLLAIARWSRSRGLVGAIPFEHSPKPADRTQKRPPASVDEYHRMIDRLEEHTALVWRLLGNTGMRLGGACSLLETDIGDAEFVITAKGRKRVAYPMTPPVREIIK